MIWIYFVLIAIGLVYAASKLTVYADQIAEYYNLSKSWVGLLVVGLVTSLPELATTLSSITGVDSPDMALGNIFGSIMFNLLILAICDAIFRKGGILRLATPNNILSAVFTIILLACMLFGLLFPYTLNLGLISVNICSVLVIFIVFFAFWLTFLQEHGSSSEETDSTSEGRKKQGGGRIILPFTIAAAGVVLCGYALAVTGDRIAQSTGLSHNVVGSLFLAVATSLPELIVSFTAMRMKAYDLMLGNILGSNIWNMFIVAISDFAYRQDAFAVPGNLGWGQIFGGFFAIAATGVVIAGLSMPRIRNKYLPVGYSSIILVSLYVIFMYGLMVITGGV